MLRPLKNGGPSYPPLSCEFELSKIERGTEVFSVDPLIVRDHFEINYLYPNGVRAFLANRQIVGCYNENSDYMMGTEGTCTIGKGPQPRIAGKTCG